jgi:putative tributyrin esterase
MVTMNITFRSPSLMRHVDLAVVIPADGGFGPTGPIPMDPNKKFRTLYLLHGYSACKNEWFMSGIMDELAMMCDCAIVMVNGDNSFYVDGVSPHLRYSEFIGKDVVEFTRNLLPLSRKREDTFIGGLSMGGYGALYNGLKHFETFGHVIALSSALITGEAVNATDEPNMMGATRSYYASVFGDLTKLQESDKNPEVLAAQTLAAAKEKNLPLDVYMACGYNDFLVKANRDLHSALDKMGFPHDYEEGPGSHDMNFWRDYLRKGMYRIIPKPEFQNPFFIEKED